MMITSVFAVLALSIFCSCIKAYPLFAPPPPYLSDSCNALLCSSPSTWPSGNNIFTLPQTRNLTLFDQSTLSLLSTDQSSSFTFTTTSSGELGARPPSVAFILLYSAASQRSLKSTELRPLTCESPNKLHLPGCSAVHQEGLQIRNLSTSSCFPQAQDPSHSNETQVMLEYVADIEALHVQAVQYYTGSKFNVTFDIFLSDALGPTVSTDDTTLFVGYITSGGEATVTSSVTGPAELVVNHDDSNAKSKHKKVVVWIVVGVSTVVFLMVLLILVFLITKHHGSPSLVISSLPARHGAPPSAPCKSLDLESSPTPPSIQTNTFQMSGTASWLKQPNPR